MISNGGRQWEFGARVAKGGFGEVWIAESAAYNGPAVAKFIRKAPGAERELLFVDLGDARNVVPIIDWGETDSDWVIVMPRAEKSLRQHLIGANGPLSVPDVMTIMTDIAAALVDINENRIVHRDIKPENILYLKGKWRLADFGISRYADATTEPETRKYAHSPPYTAPERWREERATAASDIYSLGVIAYELLSGSLPFSGPEVHDFQRQHLSDGAASLTSVPLALAALIDECLYKAPEARPTSANLAHRLERVEDPAPSPGLMRLQQAHRSEVDRIGEENRRKSLEQSEADRRSVLVDSAGKGLAGISSRLKQAIIGHAPSATLQSESGAEWRMTMGSAAMNFERLREAPPNPWKNYRPAFDVLAHAELGIDVPQQRIGCSGRRHSLWFCDAQQKGEYRWFETAFMYTFDINQTSTYGPFSLYPSEEAGMALFIAMAEFQVAWPFTPLDAGNLEEFIDRWAGWLAVASENRLLRPSRMPELQSSGTWRNK